MDGNSCDGTLISSPIVPNDEIVRTEEIIPNEQVIPNHEVPNIEVMPDEDETISVQVESVSREIKDQLLKEVSQILEEFSKDFVTIYLEHSSEPLLSILPLRSDPFYIDVAKLHANITITELGQVAFTFLTPNRERFEDEVIISDIASEIPPLLEKLLSSELISCSGFNWQDSRLGTLFQRLRKSDIDWSLIEKFDGNVVYRSRSCQFVHTLNTEPHPFFTQQCQNCQNYLQELDNKYTGGRLLNLKTESEIMDSDLMQDANAEPVPTHLEALHPAPFMSEIKR